MSNEIPFNSRDEFLHWAKETDYHLRRHPRTDPEELLRIQDAVHEGARLYLPADIARRVPPVGYLERMMIATERIPMLIPTSSRRPSRRYWDVLKMLESVLNKNLKSEGGR
jgi:hypothetical protein